ncbi:MAG: amidase [Planctomycetota bacterium]
MDHTTPSHLDRRAFLGAIGLAATGLGTAQATLADDIEPVSDIDAETFQHAQKLAGLDLTPTERDLMATDFAERVAGYKARRAFQLANATGPAGVFDPRLRGFEMPSRSEVRMREPAPGPLPSNEADIAFAPVTSLSHWLRTGAITSTRLTRIYLERLKTYGSKLRCTVTLTEQSAIAKSRRADRMRQSGVDLGPLHGIPWGAKDLFDTAGVRTTWGAAPYQRRYPETDAHVVEQLDKAGAILVAKLSLGSLAYGDQWFDGVTKNPWDPALQQGSSGSSAGSAAATAAGLVGFSLGTETYGSIVSPCMRCGTTGLRPTFGRVGRTGAMALCWSLDKVGPITRSVEDAAIVLDAINGPDASDAASIDAPFEFDANADIERLRVGYQSEWFEGPFARDRVMLDRLRDAGARLINLSERDLALPDWPYQAMLTSLYAEAAAAFEELTLSGRDDELAWQDARAWPNTFRQTWFIPAVELIQAERIRRRVMEMMAKRFEIVDVIASPSYAANLLLITNMTGHPGVVVRSGLDTNGRPHGVTLWGRLFDEGRLCNAAMALERAFGVANRRPPGFD